MVIRPASIVLGTLGALGTLGSACGARAHHDGRGAAAGDEVTLYRDHAFIRQRVEVEVPEAAKASVKIWISTGVDAKDVVVLDRGGLTSVEIHGTSGATRADESEVDADAEREPQDDDPDADFSHLPLELTITVGGPHAGHFTVELGYVTDRLVWDAAYTMITSPARDRAVLRGAVAIRNATAIALHHARIFVVDAELGPWRGRTTERLANLLRGTAPSTTPIAIPRLLGRLELASGETRIELLPAATPRKLRSVLVYDPIGTKLDASGRMPSHDLSIGTAAAPTQVTESFEIERDEATSAGLPGGVVRVLEQRPDGSLVTIGESRLFGQATRVADVDTVAIGTADGVTGHRERREVTSNDDDHRLVEEFELSIDNARSRPIEVLIREHMYRGENWALSYHSSDEAKQEGPQQVSLRTSVPANSRGRVMYIVVYTW